MMINSYKTVLKKVDTTLAETNSAIHLRNQ